MIKTMVLSLQDNPDLGDRRDLQVHVVNQDFREVLDNLDPLDLQEPPAIRELEARLDSQEHAVSLDYLDLQDRQAELEDLVLEVTKARQDQPDNQDPVGRGLYVERSKKSNMLGDKVRMLGNCYVLCREQREYRRGSRYCEENQEFLIPLPFGFAPDMNNKEMFLHFCECVMRI